MAKVREPDGLGIGSKGVIFAEIDKKGVDDSGRFSALANARTIDRDGEILEPRGVDLSSYRKNPVLMAMHKPRFESGHSPVIGKVLEIAPTEEALPFRGEFSPVGLGPEYRALYAGGFMNAFSVGFLRRDGRTEMQQVAGRSVSVRRVTSWELVEISCVAVPSNREALIRAMSQDVAGRTAYQAYSQAALVAELQRHTRLDAVEPLEGLIALARKLTWQATREAGTARRKDAIDRGVNIIVEAVRDGLDRLGVVTADLESSLLLAASDEFVPRSGDLAGPLSILQREEPTTNEIRQAIIQSFEAIAERLQAASVGVAEALDGGFTKAMLYGLDDDPDGQAGGVGGEELGGEEEAASEEARVLRVEAAKLLEAVLGPGGSAA
ncbi:MAG: HK97 family phage prohead protease [Phycisphaerae bacterium]|nr:HK97 family phage prohead protease [Phycisphaerae bacterium]